MRLAFSPVSIEEPRRLAVEVEATGLPGSQAMSDALSSLSDAMEENTCAWGAERQVAREQMASSIEALCQSHPSHVASAWSHSLVASLEGTDPTPTAAAASHLAGTAELQHSITAVKGRLLCHGMAATWTREARHARLHREYETSGRDSLIDRFRQALGEEAEARRLAEEEVERVRAAAGAREGGQQLGGEESAAVAMMEDAVNRMMAQVTAMEIQLAEADEREQTLCDEIQRLGGGRSQSQGATRQSPSPLASPSKRANAQRIGSPFANRSNLMGNLH